MSGAHLEFRRDIDKASHAVLFIHGICGSPNHFRDFYGQVPDDWSIRAILIEGHGGTVRQFSRSSMARWKEQVSRTVDELAADHASILITGHSMGTLLAIEQALRKPKYVKALFLLAVPLRARASRAAVSQSLRTVLDLDSRGDPALEAAKALYSMNPDRKIWRYLGYIPRYYELLKLMRETRGRIPQLALPCRVLMSRRDEIVSPRSADYLLVNPRIDLGWLEHSDHKYYPQGDKEFMLEDFACTCRNFL
ncbi:MAG TPA: alpha/beta fold hydrolase [Bacillota bacterium]|jgi:carboxylesterase|nr:alpha/beta fold hydrolase [Fastidiosipila sp.]HPX93042.1 alpha/beta fold hydrolase [Bacillota bacterium]HQB80885.1 alpha/beta fold hydrolase [Bacillota bacterium]